MTEQGFLPEEMEPTEDEDALVDQEMEEVGDAVIQPQENPLEVKDGEPVEQEAEASESEENQEEVKAESDSEEEGESEEEEKKESKTRDTGAEKRINGLINELRSERQSRQEYERKMEKVLKAMDEMQKAQNAEPEPDKDLDPEAYADYHKRRADLLEQQTKVSQEQIASQEEAEAITRYTQEKVSEFEQEHPDYGERFKFVRDTVVQQLLDSGLHSEESAQQEFANIAAAKMQDIYKNRGNPAQFVYRQAEMLGYGKSSETPQNGTETAPNNKQVDAATRDAEKLARGQQASKSLGKGGSSGDKGLTWESLTGLDGEEFDRAYEALEAKLSGIPNSLE